MRVIDSHTEGEPTRVVVAGGPELGEGSLQQRLQRMRDQHDDVRRALILEPRGSEAIVGALLCPPVDPACASGVIFFNNTGYLGMCGHGAIGVAVTLAWLGGHAGGVMQLETAVGTVAVAMHGSNEATVQNVPSYLLHTDVAVKIPGYPAIVGDVAWGGNWFFLADWTHSGIGPAAIPELTNVCRQLKSALREQGVVGADGGEIDHIELFTDGSPTADSRNFVLCPGDAFDRSPCGTGTSAKLACLAAKGLLEQGQTWRQESVTGGRFDASYRLDDDGQLIASIKGRAFITADATLLQQAGDPFACGMPRQ